MEDDLLTDIEGYLLSDMEDSLLSDKFFLEDYLLSDENMPIGVEGGLKAVGLPI